MDHDDARRKAIMGMKKIRKGLALILSVVAPKPPRRRRPRPPRLPPSKLN